MSFPTFLSGATGDPQRFLRRIAPQSSADLPAPVAGGYDFISQGGAITLTPKPVPRLGIRGDGMAQAPLPGQIDGAMQLLMGDLNAGDRAQLLGLSNLLGLHDTTDLTGGAFRHVMSQLAATASTPWLTLFDSPNIGLVKRLHSVLVGEFSFDAKPGGNFELTFGGVFGKHDYTADATQTAGSGSTKPIVRLTNVGSLAQANDTAGTVDNDIYLKATGAVSSGVASFLPKVGSAASYGSTPLLVPVGQWMELVDQAGAFIGNNAERAEVYVPSGATLATNDIFKIAAIRQVWSPSFPVDRVIPLINVRAYLSGIRLPFDGGFSLTTKVAKVQRINGTEKNPVRTQRLGIQDTRVKVTRQMVDLALQLALERQTPLDLVIEAYTDTLIASTPFQYGFAFVYPRLQPSGATQSIPAGADSVQEQMEFIAGESPTARTYRGVDCLADVTCIAYTDIAAL